MKITRMYRKGDKIYIKGKLSRGKVNTVRIDIKTSLGKKILDSKKYSALEGFEKRTIEGMLRKNGGSILYKDPDEAKEE